MKKFRQANVDFMLMMFRQEIERAETDKKEYCKILSICRKEKREYYQRAIGRADGKIIAGENLKYSFEEFCLT